MHPYPHLYTVESAAEATGDVSLASTGLPVIASAPPPEFDGPGGRWSPEHLLVAAVADCLILSFRGVARANKFEWHSLECSMEGTLDKVEGRTRFTRMAARATLRVPAGTDEAKAKQLLARAEHVCLISNSLLAERSIESTIVFA
jgi:organic hydroperoxide reductase OsmC/OhrA